MGGTDNAIDNAETIEKDLKNVISNVNNIITVLKLVRESNITIREILDQTLSLQQIETHEFKYNHIYCDLACIIETCCSQIKKIC